MAYFKSYIALRSYMIFYRATAPTQRLSGYQPKWLPRLNHMRLSLIELRLAQGPRPNLESFWLAAKALPRLNYRQLSLIKLRLTISQGLLRLNQK